MQLRRAVRRMQRRWRRVPVAASAKPWVNGSWAAPAQSFLLAAFFLAQPPPLCKDPPLLQFPLIFVTCFRPQCDDPPPAHQQAAAMPIGGVPECCVAVRKAGRVADALPTPEPDDGEACWLTGTQPRPEGSLMLHFVFSYSLSICVCL